MEQIDAREGARRQHRTIALFCVIQCWTRGLEALILDREDLQRLIGLERFKGARVDWLREDFREFFPYQKIDESPYEDSKGYINKNQKTFKSLRISRSKKLSKELIAPLQLWRKPLKEFKDKLKDNLSAECFMPFLADEANYDERILVSYLSLLLQGHISPKAISSLENQKETEIDLSDVTF